MVALTKMHYQNCTISQALWISAHLGEGYPAGGAVPCWEGSVGIRSPTPRHGQLLPQLLPAIDGWAASFDRQTHRQTHRHTHTHTHTPTYLLILSYISKSNTCSIIYDHNITMVTTNPPSTSSSCISCAFSIIDCIYSARNNFNGKHIIIYAYYTNTQFIQICCMTVVASCINW